MARRWHDAANGPLTGEARLLWFANGNPPPPAATPATPNDDTERERREREERERQAAEDHRVETEQEFHHRKAREMLRDGSDLDATPPKTSDLIASATGMQEELVSLGEALGRIEDLIRNDDNAQRAIGEGRLAEMRANNRIYREHADRMNDYLFVLKDELNLEAWERGDMTPSEFLQRYEQHIDNMATIDDADMSLTRAEVDERAANRQALKDAVREAVAKAHAKKPDKMPKNDVPSATEEEIWALYEKTEKSEITKSISKAAGIDDIKLHLHDDVEAVSAKVREEQLLEKLIETEKALLTLAAQKKKEQDGGAKGADDSEVWSSNNPIILMRSAWKSMNDAAGIEYMTVFEMIDACKEVIEGIKELRKQKSRLRVSRAASLMGKAVSLIPGMGGKALEALLDQQQESKNDEIKDGFIKELKNNKNDPGFADLFGDGKGKTGLLMYYHQIGDTNRTRAILEFAAGKAMLYTVKAAKWSECRLPGGIPFRNLMPKGWTEKQIDSYFSNLQFANKQGEDSQIKAGEDFVSGRSKFEDYTEPFEGAVNGLSLWFAKGIANKALSKVKNGEMSTTLTLIVVEAWEKNSLFRDYIDKDWLDRLSGDSKQLMIGMIKYDQGHLIAGAKNDVWDIEKADAFANDKDPKKRGKQRLGPLVAAVRRYLLEIDPTLANDDAETKARFRSLQAKLLACQTLTEKDKLPRGKSATFYSSELRPYHIRYNPNEMRDAAVDKLGDDFFIERSEIINCSPEVAQYILRLRDNGFDQPTKARYFLSHIIDSYNELEKQANRGDPEFRQALANFTAKQRSNLNVWIERALSQAGAPALLTEQHKDQDGRKLVLTLLQQGLISVRSIERIAADDNNAGRTRAKQLLQEYHGATRSNRDRGQPGAAPQHSTAA